MAKTQQPSERDLLNQYLVDSEKTLSGKYHYDPHFKSEPDILFFGSEIIKSCNNLDLIKKKKFYGKNVDLNCYSKNIDFRRDEIGEEHILHAAIGIVTESSEILDTVLKHKYENVELDTVNIKEELGDIMWYMAILLRDLDIDFYDVLDTNIKKLKARYGEKFTTEKALNRDLEKERKILETPNHENIITTISKHEISDLELRQIIVEEAKRFKTELLKKEKSFKFLEDTSNYNGPFLIQLISSEKDILISFYDRVANPSFENKKFIVTIEFDESFNLKYKGLVEEKVFELSTRQKKELKIYLQSKNILDNDTIC